jgi:hypothetical protein
MNGGFATPQLDRCAPAPGLGRKRQGQRPLRRGEEGFVLLLVVFLAAVMLIAMAAAVPRILVQGKREMEAETVWRGEQYVRAVRLYYRKYGRFPKAVEDFSKNPGNLHFLRKVYTDPMNHKDGSWRYIYAGPTGQLIGSVTRRTPLGTFALPGQSGNPFGPGGQSAGQGGAPGGSPGTGQGAGPQPSAQGTSAQGTQPPLPATVPGEVSPAGDQGAGGLAQDLPPAPQAPNKGIEGASTSEGQVFGGSLVGIGSKVDKRSLRFYNGYGKYREWEFIWDPAADLGLPGGLVPQVPTVPPGVGTPPPGGNPPQ